MQALCVAYWFLACCRLQKMGLKVTQLTQHGRESVASIIVLPFQRRKCSTQSYHCEKGVCAQMDITLVAGIPERRHLGAGCPSEVARHQLPSAAATLTNGEG